MPSYLTSIGTFSLSRTVFEIFDFKVFRVWPLTFRGHLRSKIFLPFESPYMPSYLTSIGTFSLSRTVFEIFDFKVFRVWPRPSTFGVTLDQKYVHHSKAHIWLPILLLWALSLYLVPFLRYWVFRVWPWPLTFGGHLRSKIFLPIESSYMPSYLTSIGTFSLSRTVFEIFDFKVFRVWPWPLTFRGHLRSNIFSPFESPYMNSYLFPIDTFSLSRTVFEIFDFKVFRVWPWPLTFRDHLRSNIFSPFESPYMTSYLTPIDTFSLYRTVFEIFDIKVFRVWPRSLTFRGHPRSKIFQLFESSYMTSYLTPIDTFSLSRTVFEIFDFKVFRVWPWPLTFRGHLRSSICSPFESPYMTSSLTLFPLTLSFFSIDTFFLSRNVFEIFDFKVFRAWPWPWTFGVTLGQKYVHHSEAHICLSILLLLALSLYLVPFLRYSTSKFLGFDLDLWPLGVTWGQKYFHHSKAYIWLLI